MWNVGSARLRADCAPTALTALGAETPRVWSAPRAMVRSDARDFSLLGYALYRLARQEKIAVKVPRAYDF